MISKQFAPTSRMRKGRFLYQRAAKFMSRIHDQISGISASLTNGIFCRIRLHVPNVPDTASKTVTYATHKFRGSGEFSNRFWAQVVVVLVLSESRKPDQRIDRLNPALRMATKAKV